MRKSRLISFLLMIAILIMFSGCATTTVKPENVRTGEKDFFDKVERAYDLEDYNKVIELTRSCADSNPTCARWLAQAHFYSDQYQESIKYYAKYLILKKEDDFPGYANGARVHMALAFSYTGQYDEAINFINDRIRLGDESYVYYEILGAAYYHKRQYDEALTALKRGIELEPGSIYAAGPTMWLGRVYEAKKLYDEAISAYKKAMALFPGGTSSYIDLAQLYLRKENYSEAINILKKASEKDPTDDKVLSTLANAYITKNYVEAVSIINTLIELRTITGIGISFSCQGDYPVVKKVMEKGPAKRVDIQIGDKNYQG